MVICSIDSYVRGYHFTAFWRISPVIHSSKYSWHAVSTVIQVTCTCLRRPPSIRRGSTSCETRSRTQSCGWKRNDRRRSVTQRSGAEQWPSSIQFLPVEDGWQSDHTPHIHQDFTNKQELLLPVWIVCMCLAILLSNSSKVCFSNIWVGWPSYNNIVHFQYPLVWLYVSSHHTLKIIYKVMPIRKTLILYARFICEEAR